MNPRIEQILLQVAPRAGEDGEYLPSLHTPEDIERFARLITAKCVEVLSDKRFNNVRPTMNIAQAMINQHFGVQE